MQVRGPGTATAYVAPTSARAGRPFKSLLKPRLAHASARRIKPGLISPPCLEGKASGSNGFSKKVLAAPGFELGAFCLFALALFPFDNRQGAEPPRRKLCLLDHPYLKSRRFS